MNNDLIKFKRILITGCAGEIAIGICRILRDKGIADEIWGCDIKPVGGCEYYFDKSIKISRADSPAWFLELKEIISENNMDLIIPTVENELAELIKIDILPSGILMPDVHIIETCLDKYKTAKFLQNMNIDVADTELLVNAKFAQKALVIKPRSGRGSQGIHFAETKEKFDELKLSLQGDQWICQQLLEPKSEEYTCGVFRSNGGDIRTISLRRSLINGMTNSGTVVENMDVFAMLRKVAQALVLVGSINVQFILTKAGPKIFEINPRFSSTVRFRHILGFQDLVWSILDMHNIDIPLYNPPAVNTRFLRAYNEIVLRN